jgi:hypothetical protein
VDLDFRIPAKCAFFRAERKRIPKTEDSLAEQGKFELSGDFINRQDDFITPGPWPKWGKLSKGSRK